MVCANNFPDMDDSVITSYCNWCAFEFIFLQCVLHCFELSIPLVHARLWHAFFWADILHCPSCLSSSLAQFNTKSDICCLFKLWHLAEQQCTLICVAFSLSYIFYCIIILDHHVQYLCINMCGKYPTSLGIHRQYFTGTVTFIRTYWLYLWSNTIK
jgi:hypothetical protein